MLHDTCSERKLSRSQARNEIFTMQMLLVRISCVSHGRTESLFGSYAFATSHEERSSILSDDGGCYHEMIC